MYRVGIDVGSTRTKYVILDESGCLIKCFSEKTPVRQKEYFASKISGFISEYKDCVFFSCGYGKANITSLNQINELKALAKGAFSSFGRESYILDIGGQDTKLIFQKQGQLREFFINDKCAAGCGRFLSNVLNLLEIPFENIDLSEAQEPEIKLSSVCAVFAQTEIVEMIAEGVSEHDIILKVIWQILIQAKKLVNKVDCNEILFTGGISQIAGITKFAEKIFGLKVIVPEYSMYLSAKGCALN